MINKLKSLLFDDVAVKVKKVTKIYIWVMTWITIIIAIILMFMFLVSINRWNVGTNILMIILTPIGAALVIFFIWLINSSLYMFCELVENSHKAVENATLKNSKEDKIDVENI